MSGNTEVQGASEDSRPAPQSTACIYKDSKNREMEGQQSSRRGMKRTKYMARSEQARGRWFLAGSLGLKSYLLKNNNNKREREN